MTYLWLCLHSLGEHPRMLLQRLVCPLMAKHPDFQVHWQELWNSHTQKRQVRKTDPYSTCLLFLLTAELPIWSFERQMWSTHTAQVHACPYCISTSDFGCEVLVHTFRDRLSIWDCYQGSGGNTQFSHHGLLPYIKGAPRLLLWRQNQILLPTQRDSSRAAAPKGRSKHSCRGPSCWTQQSISPALIPPQEQQIEQQIFLFIF